jgi:pentose-5-phosphate-3-epimerase
MTDDTRQAFLDLIDAFLPDVTTTRERIEHLEALRLRLAQTELPLDRHLVVVGDDQC